MIKLIRQDIADYIKTNITSFKDVRLYKNELENDVDWNPEFPICFITLNEYISVVESNDNETAKKKYSFSLFIANKDSAEDLADSVFDLLDGQDGTYIIESGSPAPDETIYYKINCINVRFYGRVKSLEIYEVQIEVI